MLNALKTSAKNSTESYAEWRDSHISNRTLWVYAQNDVQTPYYDDGDLPVQRCLVLPQKQEYSYEQSSAVLKALQFYEQLPTYRLSDLTYAAWYGGKTPIQFPCRVTYQQKTIAVAFRWDEYQDVIRSFEHTSRLGAIGPLARNESVFEYGGIVAEYIRDVDNGNMCGPVFISKSGTKAANADPEELLRRIQTVVFPLRTIRDELSGWLTMLEKAKKAKNVSGSAAANTGLSKPSTPKLTLVQSTSASTANSSDIDVSTLLEEVLTNPNGYYTFDVKRDFRIAPALLQRLRNGRKEPEGTATGSLTPLKKNPLQYQDGPVRLAAMEWENFCLTVDPQRHPAMAMLELMTRQKHPFNKANVVDISSADFASIAGLVAGLHRDYPDRLCVVRVVYRDNFERLDAAERQNRRPLLVKTQGLPKSNVLRRQHLTYVRPKMLALFPADWLAAVKEPWMMGLSATPYDPALLGFNSSMPESWWKTMKKIIPVATPERMIDVRSLVYSHISE